MDQMIKVIFNYITNSRPVRVLLEVSKRKIVFAFKFIPCAGKFYINLENVSMRLAVAKPVGHFLISD